MKVKKLSMNIDFIKQELLEAKTVLERFLADEKQLENIQKAAELMIEAVKNNKKIISCGNGGSHCDAMHFAEELSGKYRNNRRALPAMAISDASHISCVGNDFGYEFVFSRYLEALGQEGDVLVGFSTSGNSANVIRAVETAKAKNMKTIILTGNNGGKLAGKADVEVCVPHFEYADRTQEIHIKIVHIFIALIEKGVC